MTTGTRILAQGLSFTEGPRWRDGRLYFSDFYTHRVLTVDLEGHLETLVEVPNQPSGLGWLPDGTLLIVSMLDRKVLRLEADGSLTEHADLSGLATWHCNDMVVATDGTAWVGNFGSDIDNGNQPIPANLIKVTPEGSVSLAAADMHFPNGTVITPDGSTLIIGETFARRLTAFDIDSEGNLSGRRLWADCGAHLPDGICLDAEGAVWIADPAGNCVVRFKEGGEILDKIELDQGAFACMLGGPERKTLFICTAAASDEGAENTRTARIEAIEVSVPGAGLP
ncbi:MAG: SMP-30/gluconolactonase/LRE family protein [Pseudomonadales bacterium]|nr:SMP-30/gluconolactonase/LRE family protein [Pseudomonadales bacterium]